MKYSLLGIGLSIIGIVLSILFWGMEKAYLITGNVGFILLAVSILMSGSAVNGDRMRANFATESTEDRKERNKVTSNLLLLALPNIIIAVLVYYWVKV